MDPPTAFVLACREFVQDFGVLPAEMPAASPLAFALAALAGLVMSVTPGTLPAVPAVVGLGRGGAARRRRPAAGALAPFERSSRRVPAGERAGGAVPLVTAGYFFYRAAVYASLAPPLGLLFRA